MQRNETIFEPFRAAICRGIRSAYHSTVQPLAMCQDCRRWLDADKTVPPELGPITPRAALVAGGHLLMCQDRVQGNNKEIL